MEWCACPLRFSTHHISWMSGAPQGETKKHSVPTRFFFCNRKKWKASQNAGRNRFFFRNEKVREVFWHARFYCVDSCTVSNLLDLEGWGWWDVFFFPDFFLPTPFLWVGDRTPNVYLGIYPDDWIRWISAHSERRNKHPHVSPACVDPWWGDFVAGRIHSWCNGGRIGNAEVSRFSKPNHFFFFYYPLGN